MQEDSVENLKNAINSYLWDDEKGAYYPFDFIKYEERYEGILLKVLKDTAAGAVSLVALGAVVVGVIIFGPKILALLNWL